MKRKTSPKKLSLLKFQVNWNVPDYRDSSAYPKPNDLSDTYWQWEFLRRRQDYRHEWMKHYQATYDYLMDLHKENPPSNKAVQRPENPAFLATLDYLQPAILARSINEAELQKTTDDFNRFPILGGLPNPSIQKPATLEFKTPGSAIPKVLTLDGHPVLGSEKDDKDKLRYQFDLSQPTSPQIQKAKRLLENLQQIGYGKKVGRRKRRTPWPKYLQVLDAREAGLTFLKIGKEILELTGTDDFITSEAKKLHTIAFSLGLNFPN